MKRAERLNIRRNPSQRNAAGGCCPCFSSSSKVSPETAQDIEMGRLNKSPGKTDDAAVQYFDEEGYDAEGFNAQGYNREGYARQDYASADNPLKAEVRHTPYHTSYHTSYHTPYHNPYHTPYHTATVAIYGYYYRMKNIFIHYSYPNHILSIFPP